MSLRFKIIIAFILCIMLAFFPLLYVLQTEVKTMNMNQLEHEVLQLIDSKSNEISSWLNQRISEIKIILEHPASKSLDFSELKPYLTQLNHVIKNQYGNTNETFAIGGLDGKGWVNDTITIDISNRTYFKKLMSTDIEYIISDPVISKSDNTPIFLISYPIVNDMKEKVGFINGSVNLKIISQIAYDIDIYNGFSWIMNKKGDIYSINKDQLTSVYIEQKSLSTIIDHSNERNSGSLKLKNLSGKESTVFFSSVPYTGDWLLCTIIENSSIHAQTNNLINFVIKLGVILILVAILFSIIISGSIVKPIQKLKYNMIEVSNGNLNSFYEVKNEDEISILGKVFNQMLSDIKELINQVYKVESQKRTAELKSLQSQVSPHFLYNTLDTIQWKALDYNAFEVADMINSLSNLFRISLSNGKEFITIDDEIKHVQNYLEIQKIRYKDKINYSIHLDREVNRYLVPKLIIQPLVENSIYHGLKLKKQNGHINIDISSNKGFIFIQIIDNGLGMNKDKLKILRYNLDKSIESEHYGLYNINERLKLAFNKKYKIVIESEFDVGTKIFLRIPIISEGFECLE